MPITITAKVKRSTERAVLLEYNDEDIWVPKSHARQGAIVGDDRYEFVLSDWIAEQKGITVGDEERYIVEQTHGGTPSFWAVKDTAVNPVRVVCRCDTERDAMIISAALEMTKNKML